MTGWQRRYFPGAVIRVALLSFCAARRIWWGVGFMVALTILDVFVFYQLRKAEKSRVS